MAEAAGGEATAASVLEDDGWEDPPRSAGRDRDALHLDLRGYAGPLDLLLELVRAGRVDVGAISLLNLAVQFERALTEAIGRGDVPLSRLGDWLVAAANLALLRSRLLLPEDSREGREARREAEALRRQLADRAAVAALADWLGNRRQLGRQVFARGAPEHAHGEVSEGRGATPVADLTTLLRACLELMSRPERVPAYRPNPPDLWRPPAAVARMRRLLGEMADLGRDEALPLERFLPPRELTPTPLQRRAALASTLVAGLELARDGALRMKQAEAFADIAVSSTASPLARVA